MEMKLFNEYVKHYKYKSENTIESYEQAVKQYYEFMNVNGYDTEDDIIKNSSWSNLIMFRNMLEEKQLNPYTINARLSGLKSFFNFLVYARIISENPMDTIEKVSTNSVEQSTDFLTHEEYMRLLDIIGTKLPNVKQDNFEYVSKRDLLMVGLVLQTGLRISEVLSLTVNQIDTENKRIRVLGKGKKLRDVVFTDDVLTLLQDYTDVRNTLDIKDTDILFLSRTGKKLSRQNINVNLKKYCERAGIEKNITPHSLRHTSITQMGESGMSVAKISAVAGHSSTTTTSRYLHIKTEVEEQYIPKLF
jgi:integrase/recombinase XerD